jgi:hypothetical protein
MARDKDLKRLVRARMKKTGEAYTAARAQVVRKPTAKKRLAAPDPAPAQPPLDYAALAGMSDERIEAMTGFTWERWTQVLDGHGAAKMVHRDIAALVSSTYKVASWWTQTVTVGYERIKGLRARGQRRDGSYEAGKSRTFNVPVATLFEAWRDASIRERWLDDPGAKVRTATAPKTIRLGWGDGTIVAVGFEAKGRSKSMVALAHMKLPDRATADRLKRYWSERLDALGEVLAASAPRGG